MVEAQGKDSVFGWELNLDLYGCSAAKIRSRDDIIAFVIELCDKVLDMKRFGEPWAERFGLDRAETAGYSVVQLIETSSIVGHFSELNNAVYLDIFSCKPYDQAKVIDFCCRFFEARQSVDHFIERQ
jgi:S-adenosylmethionine/arginine decarboxylase-like enzyme